MNERIVERFGGPPPALKFMARGMRRSSRLARGGTVPAIAVQWEGLRVEPAQQESFCRNTGLPLAAS